MGTRRRRFGRPVGWVGAGLLALLLASPAAAQTTGSGGSGTGKKSWTPVPPSGGNTLTPTRTIPNTVSGTTPGTTTIGPGAMTGQGGNSGGVGGPAGFGSAARLSPVEELDLLLQAIQTVEAIAPDLPQLSDRELFFLVVMVYEDLRMQALFGQPGGTGATPGAGTGS